MYHTSANVFNLCATRRPTFITFWHQSSAALLCFVS